MKGNRIDFTNCAHNPRDLYLGVRAADGYRGIHPLRIRSVRYRSLALDHSESEVLWCNHFGTILDKTRVSSRFASGLCKVIASDGVDIRRAKLYWLDDYTAWQKSRVSHVLPSRISIIVDYIEAYFNWEPTLLYL